MFLFILGCLGLVWIPALIQIHLMFLFIIANTFRAAWNGRFKYISCSYLSVRSAVTSYRLVAFKYISCSYLSLFTVYEILYPFAFKYISCSYLSVSATSAGRYSSIQIHLMFLFINCYLILILRNIRFKYISCSYLSNVFPPFLISIIWIFPLFHKIFSIFSQVLRFIFPFDSPKPKCSVFTAVFCISPVLAAWYFIRTNSRHSPCRSFQELPPRIHYHSSI